MSSWSLESTSWVTCFKEDVPWVLSCVIRFLVKSRGVWGGEHVMQRGSNDVRHRTLSQLFLDFLSVRKCKILSYVLVYLNYQELSQTRPSSSQFNLRRCMTNLIRGARYTLTWTFGLSLKKRCLMM